MLSIYEQELLVDELQEIETKIFNISEQLTSNHELSKAWLIVYKCLQKERQKEAKMKGEICNEKK
jgi:hypothetical protein|nr:MAG TPA: hypothetical protein [Caudoviricetes sp.]